MVLPHVLEGHDNPHEVLREAERVLMPEGQVVISGFNTASLWRLRQMFAPGGTRAAPWDAQVHRPAAPARLAARARLRAERRQVRLLCAAVPQTSSGSSASRFMEKAGARWWPIAGGVYVVRAVKRVHGMRLITPAWRKERARRRALAPIPQRANGHAQAPP